MCTGIFGRGRAVIGNGSISQVRPENKMATDLQMAILLFYHSPIFSLIMMKVGAEDWELGQSVGLLDASCWQGTLYGARSSDSCGILVWALTAVLRMVLEWLISLEVQLVKLLINNSRHAV
jgi:hypothetical protein